MVPANPAALLRNRVQLAFFYSKLDLSRYNTQYYSVGIVLKNLQKQARVVYVKTL
jgi:hypothetical protein